MEPLEESPPRPENCALTGAYRDLCTSLPIDNLFPSLITHGVIDWDEKQRICSENLTQPKKVQALLDIIIKDVQNNNFRRFEQFQTVLQMTPSYNFLLGRLNERCPQKQQSSICK